MPTNHRIKVNHRITCIETKDNDIKTKINTAPVQLGRSLFTITNH